VIRNGMLTYMYVSYRDEIRHPIARPYAGEVGANFIHIEPTSLLYTKNGNHELVRDVSRYESNRTGVEHAAARYFVVQLQTLEKHEQALPEE